MNLTFIIDFEFTIICRLKDNSHIPGKPSPAWHSFFKDVMDRWDEKLYTNQLWQAGGKGAGIKLHRTRKGGIFTFVPLEPDIPSSQ